MCGNHAYSCFFRPARQWDRADHAWTPAWSLLSHVTGEVLPMTRKIDRFTAKAMQEEHAAATCIKQATYGREGSMSFRKGGRQAGGQARPR